MTGDAYSSKYIDIKIHQTALFERMFNVLKLADDTFLDCSCLANISIRIRAWKLTSRAFSPTWGNKLLRSTEQRWLNTCSTSRTSRVTLFSEPSCLDLDQNKAWNLICEAFWSTYFNIEIHWTAPTQLKLNISNLTDHNSFEPLSPWRYLYQNKRLEADRQGNFVYLHLNSTEW